MQVKQTSQGTTKECLSLWTQQMREKNSMLSLPYNMQQEQIKKDACHHLCGGTCNKKRCSSLSLWRHPTIKKHEMMTSFARCCLYG